MAVQNLPRPMRELIINALKFLGLERKPTEAWTWIFGQFAGYVLVKILEEHLSIGKVDLAPLSFFDKSPKAISCCKTLLICTKT